MDSTIENTDKEADFATEQLEETPEASSEEETEKTSEETGENAVENGTVAGRNLEEQSSSEINVDFETEKAGKNDGNTEQQAVEVVEIEEKDIIETLDEAKSVQGNVESVQETQDSIVVENRNETIDLLSNVETETQFRTSEIHSEPAKPPGEVKQQQEWTDLLGNGLLKKKIIRAGKEDGSRPLLGQEVCIRCEGTLASGDKVDVKEKLQFIIGDGDIVTALDLCVPTMLESEICELVAAARFAYGTSGREDDDEGDVPPDSEVTYMLELLSVADGPNISQLTDEQRIELGDQKRERGNDLFRREEYSLAVHSYSRALKYLGSSKSEAIIELKVKCWNNISASHLKVLEYAAARNACDSVLEVDPNNVKALFRKGKVLYAEGEYEESVELLRKANSLDPENRLIRRELYLVRQKLDESTEKERSTYQRMFGLNNDNTTSENNNTFFTWPVILGITGVAIGGVEANWQEKMFGTKIIVSRIYLVTSKQRMKRLS
ncbi:peptidyl-prolyl cis-trans isomerase FKBP8-like [Paramuricea clavata]|uniref:peptidylprolyl isomerase n=1 Tax=Paramuricea clavata TaxID=317549 RepID=A0A6S7FQV8_PARCT|nr:peptidyl-prolyl cis-trans isomerase FKBP8-like [Paramuricea clavata]